MKIFQNILISMHTFSLPPTITRPKRIFENIATLIDYIFITRPEGVLSGNLICSLSDHLGNFLIDKGLLSNDNLAG